MTASSFDNKVQRCEGGMAASVLMHTLWYMVLPGLLLVGELGFVETHASFTVNQMQVVKWACSGPFLNLIPLYL